MRKKLFLYTLIFLLLLGFSFSSKDCPNIQICEKQGKESDNPDETLAIGNVFIGGEYFSILAEVGIFQKGFSWEMGKLLGRVGHGKVDVSTPFSVEKALKNLKVLILSGGSLSGEENNEGLKYLLEEWVRKGGGLIVFSQKHGRYYSILPTPSGHPIVAYGWRES